jgi:RNA recognition motif-containing protein
MSRRAAVKKLYVGNLPYQGTESELTNWFAQAGVTVDAITIVRDQYSGEARGFGFVEINDDAKAEQAIQACHGKDFLGRTLVVNEARPPRTGGAGEGGGRGGGRPGGGGGRKSW